MLSIGGATTAFAGKLILGVVITVVAVYFFLLDGPQMIGTFMQLSPLDDRYETELLGEFDRISRAVVLATLLSAAAQGLLAGLGYWVAGMQSLFLLMLLTTVMALVPFVGAASVWISASLWLYFYEERTVAAVALAIYGAAIVSMADNVIKPLVLHGQSRLHPLLALLSVLGGVQALGPIGILVGPMVVVFLQTLLNILHREMVNMEQNKPAEPSPESE
jgi:predicted PurR-regulated permease PerM